MTAQSTGRRDHALRSRRQFLQIGITAAAWPLVAGEAHAALAGPRQGTPLLGVVYDTRFAESVAFGERAAALGLGAHPIAGDMTHLWYDEVYHRWQQRPTALAGLTAHGPMFCFGELARDVGMRVVFRAEHRQAGGGGVAHTFTGPVPMLRAALDACGRPESIWTAMADVVVQCPSGRAEIASVGRRVDAASLSAVSAGAVLTNGAPTGVAPVDAGTLYTWVIAPAVKA